MGRGGSAMVKKYIWEGCMTYQQFSLKHSNEDPCLAPLPPQKQGVRREANCSDLEGKYRFNRIVKYLKSHTHLN